MPAGAACDTRPSPPRLRRAGAEAGTRSSTWWGPNLTAPEWKGLLAALPGRTVLVNTTASSFPFLEELSQPGRVIITATDSAAQRFATVFPEYFVKALGDMSIDYDKNGRVSVWEAFAAVSAAVKLHDQQRGRLSTERPLLDDDGDRVGREAEAPGEDGTLARAIYLDALVGVPISDDAVAALDQQRRAIEAQNRGPERAQGVDARSAVHRGARKAPAATGAHHPTNPPTVVRRAAQSFQNRSRGSGSA